MPNNHPYTQPITVSWKRLHSSAQVPKVAAQGAACFDLTMAADTEMTIQPNEIVTIPTGLACEVPVGFELQIRARSGLALKSGLFLVNGIGTIDSDYRGEIKIIACVIAKTSLTIKPGDRIAQALISAVPTVVHLEKAELSSTDRGAGGFGSTGVSCK
jgi:dUTP pyrophosphatase